MKFKERFRFEYTKMIFEVLPRFMICTASLTIDFAWMFWSLSVHFASSKSYLEMDSPF